MDLSRSLIRAIEVWVPVAEVLVRSSAAYAEHTALDRARSHLTFARGSGLPGAVWAEGRAQLSRELAFDPLCDEPARAAGIHAAVALPVFHRETLAAVLVFWLGKECATASCVELWNANAQLGVLEYAAGHYSGCADFEAFSPLIQFPKGTGLPGGAWAAGKPNVMPDVRRASTFVRTGLATRGGLRFGVGLPFRRGREVAQVLTLIAAEQRPFFQAMELWERDEGAIEARLALRTSTEPVLEPAMREAPGEELAPLVLESGLPVAMNVRALADAPIEGDAAPRLAVGIPMYDDEGARSAVCLVF